MRTCFGVSRDSWGEFESDILAEMEITGYGRMRVDCARRSMREVAVAANGAGDVCARSATSMGEEGEEMDRKRCRGGFQAAGVEVEPRDGRQRGVGGRSSKEDEVVEVKQCGQGQVLGETEVAVLRESGTAIQQRGQESGHLEPVFWLWFAVVSLSLWFPVVNGQSGLVVADWGPVLTPSGGHTAGIGEIDSFLLFSTAAPPFLSFDSLGHVSSNKQ